MSSALLVLFASVASAHAEGEVDPPPSFAPQFVQFGYAGPAPSGPAEIAGTVIATYGRWAGSDIVTDSLVVGGDGAVTTVTQLGGRVGNLGMTVPHLPAPFRVGDQVFVSGVEFRGGVAVSAASVSNAAGDPVADYSVGRTELSGIPVYWGEVPLYVGVEAQGSTHIAADLVPVVDQAFQAWEDEVAVCSSLAVEIYAEDDPTVSVDERNIVAFHDVNWSDNEDGVIPYPNGAMALTKLYFIDDPSDPNDGLIIESDIEVNTGGYDFSLSGAADRPDLLSVLTHEVGHFFGLGHTCTQPGEPPQSDIFGALVPSCDSLDPLAPQRVATMFNDMPMGETSKRTVEDADILGVCAISRSMVERGSGGCSATRTNSGVLAFILVVAALLLSRRRVPVRVRRRRRRR